MPGTESKKQVGVRGQDLASAGLERQGWQVLDVVLVPGQPPSLTHVGAVG
jgi:hypothetical protein